jgi:hypothetical protein
METGRGLVDKGKKLSRVCHIQTKTAAYLALCIMIAAFFVSGKTAGR